MSNSPVSPLSKNSQQCACVVEGGQSCIEKGTTV